MEGLAGLAQKSNSVLASAVVGLDDIGGMVIFDISSKKGQRPKLWRQAAVLVVAVGVLAPCLIACSGLGLPAAGPTTSDVVSQAVENGREQFDLVNIDRKVIDTIATQPRPSFRSYFSGSDLPPEQKISIGDLIGVGIYQSIDTTVGVATGAPPASNGAGQPINPLPVTVVPDQLVMRDGTIVVPYLGPVRLVGLTTTRAEAELRSRLTNELIKPQVIVSINKSDANTVTVSGEGATNGSRVPLSPRGTRLLDVIAGVGGVKSPTYELLVRLTRGSVTATVPYDALTAHPADNIYAHPGDIIILTLDPPTFGSFGATSKPQQYLWGADSISLAQALAMTSGLDDARADPAGVFLMRYEPRSFAQQLIGSSGAVADKDGLLPVVFHLDLSDAGSYLLAQRFPMRDKDTIYIANAKLNSVQKLINLFFSAALPAATIYSTLSTTGATTAVVASPAPAAAAP